MKLPAGIPKTYLLVPGPIAGLVTPEYLLSVGHIAQKFKVPNLKITSGQRLALLGFDEKDREHIEEDLLTAFPIISSPGNLRIHVCPGKTFCKNGLVNTLKIEEEIENFLHGLILPAKVKIGISGCPRNCSAGFLKDIGLYAKKSGIVMVLGGNGGGKPRIGDIVHEELSEEEAIALTKKFLTYYTAKALKKERTARFVERIGLAEIKRAIS